MPSQPEPQPQPPRSSHASTEFFLLLPRRKSPLPLRTTKEQRAIFATAAVIIVLSNPVEQLARGLAVSETEEAPMQLRKLRNGASGGTSGARKKERFSPTDISVLGSACCYTG